MKKAFNLHRKIKEAQNIENTQVDDMEFNDFGELDQEQYQEEQDFLNNETEDMVEDINDPSSLENFLESNDQNTIIEYFEKRVTDDRELEQSKNYIAQYKEPLSDMPLSGVQKSQIITKLLEYLGEDMAKIEAPYTKACIDETNEIIKKIATETVNKSKKTAKRVFNLSKQAQHKALDNVIMYGPSQTRLDPFLRQPVSDWHIMERNKGFGLVVDDIWNIDYESIWRESIMDKYSRPYKNKDGEWVGGYIEKRFEVDKNIPETNNLQLKPGQKRKPILPEYGNTESRLQSARSEEKIEGAVNTDKPFNWKEASKKKS